MKRRCSNWLSSLQEYAEETESPRDFWLWSGIFCLGAALQRKVWLPFGSGKIFPNFYVMIIAPPGWCRKSVPVIFAKKILTELELPVYVDSPTKRAFTKKLDELSKHSHFEYRTPEGVLVNMPQAPLSCISKELSSFLAQDPKAMIEILTDLYDPHDTWKYETSGQGSDSIVAPHVGCLLATTPAWMAANLPPEAIGGGFTRRVVIVSAKEGYKDLSLPPQPSESLYRKLQEDLGYIATLVGEFKWEEKAFALYDKWYPSLKKRAKTFEDERVQPFLSEAHVIALKTAMTLHLAKKDSFILEEGDIRTAIILLEKIIATASTAFSSHGTSKTALNVDRVMNQLGGLTNAGMQGITFSNLLKVNWRNTNKEELLEVLSTLEGMDVISTVLDTKGKMMVFWKGAKGAKA